MSDLKTILKWGLVAGAIYGAYKLGQMSKENLPDEEPVSEIDEIQGEINRLQSKPNKTVKDRDIIELLKIKLKQLTA